MYFQNLETLNSNIPKTVIEEFIFWLNNLAPLYWKNINAYDYAISKKTTLDLALKLFDLAVSENVLKPKILVEDDYGNTYGFFYKNSEIPATFENYEYEYSFQVKDENKKVYFEVINRPKVSKTESEPVHNKDQSSDSVDMSQVKKSGSKAIIDHLGVIF